MLMKRQSGDENQLPRYAALVPSDGCCPGNGATHNSRLFDVELRP